MRYKTVLNCRNNQTKVTLELNAQKEVWAIQEMAIVAEIIPLFDWL